LYVLRRSVSRSAKSFEESPFIFLIVYRYASTTGDDVLAEMAELPKAVKPAAEHLIDFEVPLYNM
jgi:hypothetical protein